MKQGTDWTHSGINRHTRKANTMTTKTTSQLDKDLRRMVPQWTRLFKALKQDIADEYRASDDPFDNTPGMCVTIGFTPANPDEDKAASWSYQTGDNSYTGGAYHHPHWAVVSLYRRSNSRELAEDCASQIGDLVCQ